MSRIVYIECKNGRPVLDEEGWGICCETLTLVEGESENWKAYVPADVRSGGLVPELQIGFGPLGETLVDPRCTRDGIQRRLSNATVRPVRVGILYQLEDARLGKTNPDRTMRLNWGGWLTDAVDSQARFASAIDARAFAVAHGWKCEQRSDLGTHGAEE